MAKCAKSAAMGLFWANKELTECHKHRQECLPDDIPFWDDQISYWENAVADYTPNRIAV
jgi:hypothetical protein